MLRWLQKGKAPEASGLATGAEEQLCPGLARVLQRILTDKKQPEVLDLGQFSRTTAVYLAHRGARVTVDDFEPPPPTPAKPKKGESGTGASPVPVVLPHPDRKFDLVLAWEHGDFVPPDRLQEFAAEVARVLVPGGWLLLYAQDNQSGSMASSERPGAYRLMADDRIVHQAAQGPTRPRWNYPNRVLERALAPLSIQSIHLQRNRVRELVIRKPGNAA
jgi:SAM-dependent methyltransferase